MSFLKTPIEYIPSDPFSNISRRIPTRRIAFIDELRALSIMSLVLINTSTLLSNKGVFTYEEYVLFSTMAFGVPIFLMLLGTLMLERDYYDDIPKFLKGRFMHIILPFLLWNTVIAIVYTYYHGDLGLSMFGLTALFKTFLLQHWYAWMLIGIYLSLPILNSYIKETKIGGAEYFLVLSFLAVVIYQALEIFNTPTYFNLTFFIGPIIYLFLGYYLDHKEFKSGPNKMIWIGLILFLATTAFIVYFDVFHQGFQRTLFLHHYNFYTRSYMDVSLVIILQAAGVFLFWKYINFDSTEGIFKRFALLFKKPLISVGIKSISRSCYGIYLTHQTMLLIIFLLVDVNYFNAYYWTFILAFLTFVSSWGIITVLRKIGIPGYYIGYD
ncbi:MAG: acyltransferase [Methanobrevibacter boviskoreani]|uniref:acyltransferase n=2 Tax=Methanobacteriaceae TaxID=2159 RepID=UPI0006940CDF|nr:acyltransferase [Methanobrevibacter sp. AbM4]